MNDVLARLNETLQARRGAEPASSYVAQLHHKGLDAILKKLGEEATETVLAAKGNDKAHVVRETADLWFHSMVMLSHLDIPYGEVLGELERRFDRSGLEEKASRTTIG